MTKIKTREISINGNSFTIAEAGSGPLVILLHGFPECWYSWRNQIPVLAEAGYHVVAPDQRGYGKSYAPESIDDYSILHLVGDIEGLVEALDEETAVVIGHDWGAPVAWTCAQMRPDVFRAVVGMSVPLVRLPIPPTQYYSKMFGDKFFYQLYFQTPGVAEHELQHDVGATIRKIMVSSSGENSSDAAFNPQEAPPASSYMLEFIPDPGDNLPSWLSKKDVNYYVSHFSESGFRGSLNWYRNLDNNWELTKAFADRKIEQPAMFIHGGKDLVPFTPELEGALRLMVPNLWKIIELPKVGHWTAQEASEDVNKALIEFLASL